MFCSKTAFLCDLVESLNLLSLYVFYYLKSGSQMCTSPQHQLTDKGQHGLWQKVMFVCALKTWTAL